MKKIKVAAAAALSVASIAALAGCSPLEADTKISVTQDATSCELSQTTFAAGVVTFVIQNVGDSTAEFYVLKAQDDGIVSEIENIGAGLTRELTLEIAEGEYRYSCEQMDGGEPIEGKLNVTEATKADEISPEASEAIAAYREFVIEQADQLLAETARFAEAIAANDVELAKQIYAPARVYWERIEPVAESFGDLDPKMDARDGDLEPGVAWTGWHYLEKQLWVSGLDSTSVAIAEQLVADTKDLVTRIGEIELTLSQISNGAKELLDEVATGKVTGEEERYSHTDLWDFEANVAGAEMALEVSMGILKSKDAALLEELQSRFATLRTELDKHRLDEGFKLYTDLSAAEVKELATLVEALSEPLSKMTAALIK